MSRVLSPYVLGSQVVKNQRAYTKDDFIKTKFLFRILFLVAFASILSIFYIWSRVQIVQVGYEINSLKNNQRQLAEENKRIQMEVSTLKSPQRLQKLVSEKMGMHAPRSDQIQNLF